MDFDRLLKPYHDGGTKEKRVKRTIGTIVDYLLNKKQYPLEIIGGAIFLVFNWLNAGNKFKGDGTYGSRGRELVTAIRMKCDDLLQSRLEAETYKAFIEFYAEDVFKLVDKKLDERILDLGGIELQRRRFVNWWAGRKVYDVAT